MIRRAVIFSLFLVSPCFADIVLPGSNGTANMIVTVPVPVGDGSEQLLSVTILIDSLGTSAPGGFEGFFTGPFHQQDLFGAIVSPTLDDALEGTNVSSATDTHFLFTSAQLISITAPTEDRNDAASTEPAFGASGPSAGFAGTSFGSSISGTFALTTGATDPLPLIQLVVPNGSTVRFGFNSSFDSGSPLPESFAGSFQVVPEPSSWAFLCVVAILFGSTTLLMKQTKYATRNVEVSSCPPVAQAGQ